MFSQAWTFHCRRVHRTVPDPYMDTHHLISGSIHQVLLLVQSHLALEHAERLQLVDLSSHPFLVFRHVSTAALTWTITKISPHFPKTFSVLSWCCSSFWFSTMAGKSRLRPHSTFYGNNKPKRNLRRWARWGGIRTNFCKIFFHFMLQNTSWSKTDKPR